MKRKGKKQAKMHDISPKTLELTDRICEMFVSNQDPSGSYTGTSIWGDPHPEQDADDL